MTQISNKALALLVLATLAVVITATSVQLGGFTGLSTGVGDVTLTIDTNLEIEVFETAINFGNCQVNSSRNIILDSSEANAGPDGTLCSNSASFPSDIQVRNIGNVVANVNVTPQCNLAGWLNSPGDGTRFNITTVGTLPGAGACTSPASNVPLEDNSTEVVACNDFSPNDEFKLDVRLSIAPDTATGTECVGNNQLTFIAIDAS